MSTATVISGILPQDRSRAHWVPYYTSFISLCGFIVAMIAIVQYKNDWSTLALFAGAAAVAQLTSVQLFTLSRSRISIVNVAVSAAMVILGAWGAILASFAGGLMTVITTSARFHRIAKNQSSVHWWQRVPFNTGMRVLSAGGSSLLYLWLSGITGSEMGSWLILPLFVFVITDEVLQSLFVTAVVNLQTGRPLQTMWQRDRLWAYPITIASGVIGGGGIGFAYQMAGTIGLSIFMLPIVATGYALHLYINRTRSHVDRLEDANRQLEQANLGLLQTLASVIDAYDIYTFGHSAQVARYAGAIAGAMGLSKEEQARIVRGGLIHDIGKIGVSDAIIGKKGRLTDEEYEALKLHTVIGAEIVSQMPQFQELIPLVRHHHERWDGRGYPDGLKGEETTLGARIMGLADSVEAMLSDRPYQSTRSLTEVIAEVTRCSGSQFDPQVVEAFLTVTKTHGDGFFVNSASTVAHQLEETGAMDTLDKRCYIKKSMISRQLKNAKASLY